MTTRIKITAFALSAAIALSLCSCGSDIAKSSVSDDSKSVSQAEAKETETGEDSAAEALNGYSSETGVYTDSLITITADPDLWEYSDGADIENGVCVFSYISDDAYEAATTLNVVTMEDAVLDGMSFSEYTSGLKESYESMDGYTVIDAYEEELDGNESMTLTARCEISEDIIMKTHQTVVTNGRDIAVVTYAVVEYAEDYIEPLLEDILDSFSFV